jgi:hypothetical protein
VQRSAAADVAGTWTSTFTTDIGEQQYTFTFTSTGGQMTGSAKSNLLGETKLENLKVDGDKITFEENAKFQDMPLKIVYTGTIAGDEIKFTRMVADMFTEQLVAKRSK